jgi:hypothetical protein
VAVIAVFEYRVRGVRPGASELLPLATQSRLRERRPHWQTAAAFFPISDHVISLAETRPAVDHGFLKAGSIMMKQNRAAEGLPTAVPPLL